MSGTRTALALTEATWAELAAALEDRREVAGVLSAHLVETVDGDVTLLARHLAWAPEDAYVDRSADGLALTSPGWVPAARAALAEGSSVVFVHTHPRGVAVFSERDDAVDAAMRSAITGMGGSGRYAALVVAGTSDAPTVAARLYPRSFTDEDGGGSFAHREHGSADAVVVDRFRIVGERVRLVSAATANFEADIFDRQVRAFGPAGQATLTGLHAGVVGAGGTGSAVAEQLTRLGVGRLTLVDDDNVTAATPTRGYGMTIADIGQPKVEVLANHLTAIGLGTAIRPVTGPLQGAAARQALAHADVVFSCVDGHGARLVLNRWAYAHLAPVIDIAVLVDAPDGVIAGIDGRVTWLAPSSACLLCRGRLDAALAYAEMLDPDERRRLAGEGYAHAADTAQPAVVSLTTLVSSLAVTELLLRLFGLADIAPTELLLRVTDRELRRNRLPPRAACFCSAPEYLGRGFTEPHLDLMWP